MGRAVTARTGTVQRHRDLLLSPAFIFLLALANLLLKLKGGRRTGGSRRVAGQWARNWFGGEPDRRGQQNQQQV